MGWALQAFVLALVVWFSCGSVFAEEKTAESQNTPAPLPPVSDSEIKLDPLGIITNIPGNYGAWAKRTFRSEQILPFSIVVGTTALGMATDAETYRYFHDLYEKKPAWHKVGRIGDEIGHGSYQIGLGAVFALTGWIGSNRKAVRTGFQITEAVLTTGIMTQVLKRITGRQSPIVATTPTGKWQWFTNPVEYQKRISAHDAFPSGHVATFMATATVIQENYPENIWLPYVTYGMVAFVGVGMVTTGGHWFSDYPLAIFLGYNMGKVVTRNNNPDLKDDPKKLKVSLWTPGGDTLGLLFSKAF